MSKVLKNLSSITMGEVCTATYPGKTPWVGVVIGSIDANGVTIAEAEPKVENLMVVGNIIPIDINVTPGESINFTGACYVEMGTELANIHGGTMGDDGWESPKALYVPNKAFVLATKDASMQILIPNAILTGWFTGKLTDTGSALLNFKISPVDPGATLSPFKITKAVAGA